MGEARDTNFFYMDLKNLGKKEMTLEPFDRASQKGIHVYHAHLHFIEIMFSKFHLDNFETVEGV